MRRAAAGFTLIEIVVAITLVGICASTMFGFLSVMATRSAEGLVSEQSVILAEAYLQEALSKNFAVTANAAGRQNFNDVRDYNGLNDVGARDQQNNPIPGLGGYQVQIAAGVVAFPTVAANQSVRVLVTVTDPYNEVIRVSAFKMSP